MALGPSRREWLVLVVGLLVVGIVLALCGFQLPPFYVRVLGLFMFSAGLAMSWNILGGFAGYWSFGHAAFVGIGAFAAGMTAPLLAPLHGWVLLLLTLLVAAVAAALVALVLAYPLLRLRGIYFAIAMLGVSEVIAELTGNLDWFGGAIGLMMPPVAPRSLSPERFFFLAFAIVSIAIFVIAWWIKHSRFGYGLASIREDEDTARMLAVPTERYKITAFVLSAALVGICGALYAYSLGYFTTDSVFRIDFSLNMIVYTLIGGIGTLLGPVVGTAIMIVLTQIVLSNLLDLHVFFTGALVVVFVLAAPGGLLGLAHDWRRRTSTPDGAGYLRRLWIRRT